MVILNFLGLRGRIMLNVGTVTLIWKGW